MTSTNYLAKRIKTIYDFNEFELKPENLVFLSTKFLKIINDYKLNDKIVNSFFDDLEIGKLGNMFKNPLSILSMFYQYQDKKRTKLST